MHRLYGKTVPVPMAHTLPFEESCWRILCQYPHIITCHQQKLYCYVGSSRYCCPFHVVCSMLRWWDFSVVCPTMPVGATAIWKRSFCWLEVGIRKWIKAGWKYWLLKLYVGILGNTSMQNLHERTGGKFSWQKIHVLLVAFTVKPLAISLLKKPL